MTETDLPLLLRRDGAVEILRINRPGALNAIDLPTARAFLAAARSISADRSVRAVLRRGEGKGFMAGGDLAVLRSDPSAGSAALIGTLHEALALLDQADAPVVAQVHSVTAGAGAGSSLVLQADFVIAAEGTPFNLAYVNIGTSCDAGASWSLPRWISQRRALGVALLGDTFDAANAERIGLVNRVVPPQLLGAEALALAQRLSQGPTATVGHLRRLIRGSLDRALPDQLAAEVAAFQRCAASTDFRIGLEAFFAKQQHLLFRALAVALLQHVRSCTRGPLFSPQIDKRPRMERSAACSALRSGGRGNRKARTLP